MLLASAVAVAAIYLGLSSYLTFGLLESTLKSATRECRRCREDHRLSREDMLIHLEDVFASNGAFLWLNRMTMMAPLLGVVLTALGFISLAGQMRAEATPATGIANLESYLSRMYPLFYGVVSGALLAIINQGMVQYAGHRLRTTRQAARLELFHAIPLSDERRRVEERLGRVSAVLDSFAGRITGLGVAIDTAAQVAAHEITGKVQVLSQALGAIADSLQEGRERSGHIAQMIESDARGATAAVSQSLSSIEASIKDFAAKSREHLDLWAKTLDQSGSALGATIGGFASTAKSLSGVVSSLAVQCGGMGESVRSTQESARGLLEASKKALAFAGRLEEGLERRVQATVNGLDVASDRCEKASSSLAAAAARLDTSSASLTMSSDVLKGGVAMLEEGFGNVSKDADGFSARLKILMGEFSGRLRALTDSTDEARKAAVSLEGALSPISEQSHGVLLDTRGVIEEWRAVIREHERVVRELSRASRPRREPNGRRREAAPSDDDGGVSPGKPGPLGWFLFWRRRPAGRARG